MAVSYDGVTEAEGVLTDPKPAGEGDAICMQNIQTEENPHCWTTTIWDG